MYGGDTVTRRKRGQEHCPQEMEPESQGSDDQGRVGGSSWNRAQAVVSVPWVIIAFLAPKVGIGQGHQKPPQGLPAMTSKVLHVREPGKVAERSPEMPLSSQHPQHILNY